MTIKKFENVWGNSGDCEDFSSTDPLGTKQDLGFVGGDQPEIERFNELFRRAEDRINTIIQERINSFSDTITYAETKSSLATKLWNKDWSRQGGDDNVLVGGSTKAYQGMCSFINADDEPRLLVLDYTNLKIEVWDPRTLTLVVTTNALDDDLPSGSAEVWECNSICTDGTYVYVSFSTATTSKAQIQSWEIDETASDWDVNSGWAATGQELQGSGAASSINRTKLIVASSTRLAVACPFNSISASNSPAIQIIDIADGTIESYGAGDATTTNTPNAYFLASDGTNIFFTTTETTTPISKLCSCTIADATAGCGGANFPLTIDTGSSTNHPVIAVGDLIVTFGQDNSTYDEVIIYTSTATDADLDQVIYGRDTKATPDTGQEYFVRDVYDATFDGLNIWAFGSSVDSGHYNTVCIKIDASKLYQYSPTAKRSIEQIADCYILVPLLDASALDFYNNIVFDGRDIWVNAETAASLTYSGDIFRLPLALFRS